MGGRYWPGAGVDPAKPRIRALTPGPIGSASCATRAGLIAGAEPELNLSRIRLEASPVDLPACDLVPLAGPEAGLGPVDNQYQLAAGDDTNIVGLVVVVGDDGPCRIAGEQHVAPLGRQPMGVERAGEGGEGGDAVRERGGARRLLLTSSSGRMIAMGGQSAASPPKAAPAGDFGDAHHCCHRIGHFEWT